MTRLSVDAKRAGFEQSLGNILNMQSNPFSAIQSAVQAQSVQLACRAINHLLKLEPTVQAHLKAHAGRTVLLRWESMLFVPTGEQSLVIGNDLYLNPMQAAENTADVTVTVLTGVLQAPASERLRFIRIEGDALLAQDLSLVTKQLRWDAEHDLANVIGGAPARWLVTNAAKAATLFEQAVEQMKNKAASVVTHYPGWAVGGEDMQSHRLELEALKTRIDALAKRIAGVAR
jgi:ubiquinone biosynthesis protein UbiJ